MEIQLGTFVLASGRYTLFQDDNSGQIYYRTRGGQKETITPLPNGHVKAFGQASLPITPLLPNSALTCYKHRRTAQK